jgi:carboxypeptidase Q
VFTNYGATVVYRRDGPSRAAALGATAVLIRAVGPTGLRTPHTGATVYADNVPKIAAAAISAEDADRFQRLQARGVRIRVKLSMEAHFDPTRRPTTSLASCAAAISPTRSSSSAAISIRGTSAPARATMPAGAS